MFSDLIHLRSGYCFTPYQRLWLYNGAPLVAFYDTLGIRRTYSRLKPPASSRGYTLKKNKDKMQLKDIDRIRCKITLCVLTSFSGPSFWHAVDTHESFKPEVNSGSGAMSTPTVCPEASSDNSRDKAKRKWGDQHCLLQQSQHKDILYDPRIPG